MDLDVDRGAFGPVLRRMRLAAQLSQEELAERARLSVESISALERGRRKAPYRETVAMIAEALRLSEDERRELAAAAKRPKAATAATIVYDSLPDGLTSTANPAADRAGELHHLPNPPTKLIGRATELAQLQALSESNRLLTIVGAGGTGKTRLVIELARSLHALDRIDTRFIDLAPLRDVSLTAGTMRAAIGATERSTGSDLEALTDAIGNRPMLLVVDNCEHVIDEVGRVIGWLLARCPNVKVIATSREALEIAGETALRLSSLRVPPDDPALSPDELRTFSAVALFIERAQACNSDLVVTAATLAEIGSICRRLDGIPLAIELAASRTPSLSIPDLSRRLAETFNVLTGGKRGALPRQQTLRALIDWSYDLLSEREQILFRRLSVFAGGWPADALDAVCAGDPFVAEEIENTLFSLVAKSLVVADTRASGTRYRLLEATRVYGREKLAGDELRNLEFRHATWVAQCAARAYDCLWTLPHMEWMQRYSPELDNMRLALKTILGSDSDPLIAAQIVTGLTKVWKEGGLLAEGRRWVEAVLENVEQIADPSVRGRLWWTLAVFTSGKQSVEACRQAIAQFDAVSNPWDLSDAYLFLGSGLWQIGELANALVATDKAIEYGSQAGIQRTARYALALDMRGLILTSQGNYEAARASYMQSFELFEMVADERGMGGTKANLAELEFLCGNVSLAISLLDEASKIFGRSPGATSRLAMLRANSAAYRLATGDFTHARDDASVSLALARQSQESLIVTTALQHLALVLAVGSRAKDAALLLGYIDRWFERTGHRREPMEQRLYELLRTSLEEQLAARDIALFAAHGQLLSEQQATDAASRFVSDMQTSNFS